MILVKIKTQRGFTLAELTLAVFIISILIVGFAPILTKRIQDNIKVSNALSGEGVMYLYEECADKSECTPAADGSRAYDCKFSAPANAKTISVVLVSGGGGGAGATEAVVTPYNETVANATNGQSQKKEINIVTGMAEVTVAHISGSGGGGGGGSWAQIAGGGGTHIPS